MVQANYETPSRATTLQRPLQPAADPTPYPPAEESRATLPRREKQYLPTRNKSSSSDSRLPKGLGTLWTTGGALALVLGLFFVFAWIMRRAAPKTIQPLPTEAVEVLGRAPLIGRQHVHLIRCGNKLLLVNVTTDGAKTLTEITDPVEVDRLAGLCAQSRAGSAAAAFRQVFEQFNHAGRLEDEVEDQLSTGSLFRNDRTSLMEARDV